MCSESSGVCFACALKRLDKEVKKESSWDFDLSFEAGAAGKGELFHSSFEFIHTIEQFYF